MNGGKKHGGDAQMPRRYHGAMQTRDRHMLLADDSPAKIALLRSVLQKSGHKWTVHEAQTVQDAQALMERQHFTHAFIDYFIPKGNGPVIIAALKQSSPAARIVLFTSSESKERYEEALQAGAELCICSADELDIVERRIARVLDEWVQSA